jgi:gamma-butyrobetaine dioxygenase
MNVQSVSQGSRTLRVRWSDGKEGEFHYLWLRDNCPCPSCRHPKTKERLVYTADIPSHIVAKSAAVDGNAIAIEWSEGAHRSQFDADWLRAHAGARADDLPEPVLWGREFQDKRPVVSYDEMMGSDAALERWIDTLLTYGFVVARGAPPKADEIERFGKRVAYLREVIFGRARNIKSEPNPYNVAFTSVEVKPHTDLANYANPPGVQFLFCLVHEAQGGDTILVDGFNVACKLRSANPRCFDVLARTEVPFRIFSDTADVRTRAPTFTVDDRGSLRGIRFSNQCLEPLDLAPDRIEPFYDAYRDLEILIGAPDNRITFRLEPGDLLAMNNHRVLHSRTAFDPTSGRRHLQVASMEMDDVLSRRRILKRAKAA